MLFARACECNFEGFPFRVAVEITTNICASANRQLAPRNHLIINTHICKLTSSSPLSIRHLGPFANPRLQNRDFFPNQNFSPLKTCTCQKKAVPLHSILIRSPTDAHEARLVERAEAEVVRQFNGVVLTITTFLPNAIGSTNG